jgi:hypothetical protein
VPRIFSARRDKSSGDTAEAESKKVPSDPGAHEIIWIIDHAAGLTAALKSLVGPTINNDDPGLRKAFENTIKQSRELRAGIARVHCDTQDGRGGQELALRALLLTEQAVTHLLTALSTSDRNQVNASLTESENLAGAAQKAAEQSLTLLTK